MSLELTRDIENGWDQRKDLLMTSASYILALTIWSAHFVISGLYGTNFLGIMSAWFDSIRTTLTPAFDVF